MPNEFQRVMDSMLGKIRGVHVYLIDVLFATGGSEKATDRSSKMCLKFLTRTMPPQSGLKVFFSQKKIECLGFQLSNKAILPAERKYKFFAKMKQPNSKTDVRSLIGPINQFDRFVRNQQLLRNLQKIS